MNSSINGNSQALSFSRLKEVRVSNLLMHLKALQKLVQSKPVISPIFLVYRENGAQHSASFEDGDWILTFGIKKDIRIGYHRKQPWGNKFSTYYEEYALDEIPYKLFVPLDQPLPLPSKR